MQIGESIEMISAKNGIKQGLFRIFVVEDYSYQVEGGEDDGVL
jgi:hypothetical protein